MVGLRTWWNVVCAPSNSVHPTLRAIWFLSDRLKGEDLRVVMQESCYWQLRPRRRVRPYGKLSFQTTACSQRPFWIPQPSWWLEVAYKFRHYQTSDWLIGAQVQPSRTCRWRTAISRHRSQGQQIQVPTGTRVLPDSTTFDLWSVGCHCHLFCSLF